MNRFPLHALTAASLALMTNPALAQTTTFPDDVLIEGDLKIQVPTAGPGAPNQGSLYVEANSVIDGSLCLGNSCSPTTTFANDETLKMFHT